MREAAVPDCLQGCRRQAGKDERSEVNSQRTRSEAGQSQPPRSESISGTTSAAAGNSFLDSCNPATPQSPESCIRDRSPSGGTPAHPRTARRRYTSHGDGSLPGFCGHGRRSSARPSSSQNSALCPTPTNSPGFCNNGLWPYFVQGPSGEPAIAQPIP